MIQVALLDDYQDVALRMAPWEQLEGVKIRSFNRPLKTEAEAADRLKGFQVIMVMRERMPFPRSLMERLPELRLLATGGMRNAAIDMAAAAELGIVVCGTEGGGVSTVELTWGLLLSLLRNIPAEHNRMREGKWQETVGVGLEGKTLGLLGLGRIGGQVAAIAHPFQMRVLAWSENLTSERAAECGAQRVEKDELLAQADVVSIHLKLSERSQGLLGEREFGVMKPTACLVNTSRGPIVNEGALIEALQSRAIAGAGLDVFDEEPLPPSHPLRTLDNVVLTPHLGYVTEEVYRLFYGQTLENIRGWLAGNPERVLNPEVLEAARRPRKG